VALLALVEAGHDIAVVITRAEKRRGRNEAPRPTPVGVAAAALGLPVSYRVEDATTVGAELGVVVAFGRIIKPDVLAALPMVNVHFSLLPRWRGAAPVERAILAGDRITGVCLMVVDEGLDTGAVYQCREAPIEPWETASDLTARLARLGADLLVESLADGLGQPVPQTGEPIYAEKITPADLHLDWTHPADQLHRVVRVGRAWTTWRGDRLLVLQAEPVEVDLDPPGSLHGDVAATGAGGLRLITVQPEGRRALPAAEWLRGARPQPGEVLGA
jgi:methionyl-tRNA formyltransferase